MFDAIEDGLVAAIKTILPSLKTVDSYAGDFEDEIDQLLGRCPAVYVMFSGYTTVRDEYGEQTFKPTFTTLIAAKDLRGKKTARTKSGGAYDIIKALIDPVNGLTGKDLGLEIDSLETSRASLVFTGKSLVVYGLDWVTDYSQ